MVVKRNIQPKEHEILMKKHTTDKLGFVLQKTKKTKRVDKIVSRKII